MRLSSKSLFYSRFAKYLFSRCGSVGTFASTIAFFILFVSPSFVWSQDTRAVLTGTDTVVSDTPVLSVSDSATAVSFRKQRYELFALKNNLLYDAVLTPNLELEFRLAPKWTIELATGFNPFPLDDKKEHKWRHLLVYVQPKYWFCGAFTRDFIAFNAAYSHYNVALGNYPIGWIYTPVKTNRFQGDAVMAGVSYGWHFPVSTHFSIELEAGVDGGLTWYDRFECQHCGKRIEWGRKFFAVPKAGVNLVVLLGGDKQSLRKRCDCGKDDVEEENTDTVYNKVIPEPVDTIVPEAVDTVVAETIDTIPAVVPDTIVPEVIDSVIPEVIDTVIPVVMDTIVPVVEDTIVPEPVDTVVPEQTEAIEHEEQLRRLRSGVFRPYSEYVPYTQDMVLSEDTNAIYLHFDVGVSKIVEDYMHNDEILDSIMTIMAEYMSDDNIEIRLIQIVGMASFDGSLQGNERLARNRAIALRDYIKSEYALPDSLFAVCNGGEGWSELRWHINQREFDGKEAVLKIIDTEPNLDIRERKIKQLDNGNVYKYLKQNVTRFQRNAGNLIVFYEEKNNN